MFKVETPMIFYSRDIRMVLIGSRRWNRILPSFIVSEYFVPTEHDTTDKNERRLPRARDRGKFKSVRGDRRVLGNVGNADVQERTLGRSAVRGRRLSQYNIGVLFSKRRGPLII